jgi:hypothetical protein
MNELAGLVVVGSTSRRWGTGRAFFDEKQCSGDGVAEDAGKG